MIGPLACPDFTLRELLSKRPVEEGGFPHIHPDVLHHGSITRTARASSLRLKTVHAEIGPISGRNWRPSVKLVQGRTCYTNAMTPAFSAYLNGLRFFAAFIVLVGHGAYRMLDVPALAWIYSHDIARDAVIVFFVLSGLVIAYSAERKADLGVSRYAADRLGRLWSVAIPALVLTVLVDIAFEAFGLADVPRGPDDPALWSVFGAMGLTFTNQLWWLNLDIATNTPWWSLGYEAWYYAIFAAVFFLRGGTRLFWTSALILCAGPKLWLLAPAWVVGVIVWRAISRRQHLQLNPRVALWGAGTTLAVYLLMQGIDGPNWIKAQTELSLGSELYDRLARSGPFVWLNLLGLLTGAHILCVARLCAADESADGRIRRAVHWVADGTYSLYLVHMPIMWAVDAVLPADTPALWRGAALLLIPLGASFLFAEIFERRDWGLRARLRAMADMRRGPRSVNVSPSVA